jgi:hypothetical protein
MSTLAVTQIAAIKSLVDTLASLDLSPLHLRIDAKTVGDPRPDISMWMQARTDFERVCAHLRAKAIERRYSGGTGQREWYAEHDHDGHRLLIQCVSFAHHADWMPRDAAPDQPAPADLPPDPCGTGSLLDLLEET